MNIRPISDEEFNRVRKLIFDSAGISLCPSKKMMVSSRLQKRLAHYGMSRFSDYINLINQPSNTAEKQRFIDLLTTNETYFFREPAHFDFLRQMILPHYSGRPMRLWSAACSSGEEVYSLAMEMADSPVKDWYIMGSDISERVLEMARNGHYPMERNGGISADRLRRYCLKGVRQHLGTFMIADPLHQRCDFKQLNLITPLRNLGHFDVIFLRNVLIYFEQETKRRVLDNVLTHLNHGGYLFISHTENLRGLEGGKLETIKSSIFRRL
ncbi:protein-glutamate O-methyltransferase CheR [Ectothiorhodospiraceae bacterium BW-2]|nr:protein-glutamate O-methyltransferase CheR [Ectothiorhodospiraceae bacterium BW-2]